MSMHAIGPLKHDTTLLDGVTNVSFSPGIEEIVQGGDGRAYNDFIAVGTQRPVATVDSVKVGTWLGHIGVGGLSIGDDPLEMYLKELASYSTRETTGLKFAINQGVILPRTLSVGYGAELASLSSEIIMIRDGENAPYATTEDAALPSGDALNEAYGLGAITINAVDAGLIQNLTIDFGIEAVSLAGKDDIDPSYLYIRRYQPTISFQTLMASQAHALGVAGQQQNVSITLKKRSGASYASAGHLTFATTLARVSCQQLSGAHEGEVMADIRVTTAHDGTNHPITMTVSI